jgi:hypothetical protein
MKSMLISTAIILAIGLGGSLIYQAFAERAPDRAASAHQGAANVPVQCACPPGARLVLVQT